MKAAWKMRRLVVAIWAIGLLLSLGTAWPFHRAFGRAANLRPIAESLSEPGIDILAFSFIEAESHAVRAALPVTLLALLVYAVVHLWLLGGVLTALRDRRRPRLREFVDRATAHVGRFARLGAWTLLGYALLAGAIVALSRLASKLSEQAVLEQAPLLWQAGLIIPALALLALWSYAAEEARARIILGDFRATRLVLGQRFLGSLRRPASALAWLGWWIAFFVLAWCALGIVQLWSFPAAGGVILLVILRQLLALARGFVRFAQLELALSASRSK